MTMVLCEYLFKSFYALGDNQYFNAWAAEIDDMFAAGWRVVECYRNDHNPGFWTTVLGRPEHAVCLPEVGNLPLNREDDDEYKS